MTLEYWEGDTLKGDHSRATNPTGTSKHEAQKPASHMPQSETVCTDRQFIQRSTTVANLGSFLTLMSDPVQGSLCFTGIHPVHRNHFHLTQNWACLPFPEVCLSKAKHRTGS